MINIDIKYPILLIRKNDKNLYATTSGLGLISKGGGSFYKKDMTMIDSDGNVFELMKSNVYGRAKLIDSLRWFQPMYQMNLEFRKKEQIDLNKLKKLLIEHISQNPKHWLTLDTIDGITESINQKNDFGGLIKMFK